MIIKSYEHYGYLIEIHEHPIYHDFEFVIKTLDARNVIETSTRLYESSEEAESAAQLVINNL